MKEVRVIYKTVEYQNFYDKLDDDDAIKKIAYLETIMRKEKIISSKIAKKLVGTDLYELRILLKNQYRVLFFTIDSEDLNQATMLLLLNGFIKKSTKDYPKQIKQAYKILAQWEQDQN